MNVRYRKGRGAKSGDPRLAHLVRLLLVVFAVSSLVTGCEVASDIQAEMHAEEIARKYGEELPADELGPYRGFTREEYFKHKCDSEAGEFIYKTVDNVEGVFQMRPRDPRDYFDRLRKGDIPKDPWGHTNTDARTPWMPFMRSYEYFETAKDPGLRPFDSRIGTMVVERPVYTDQKYWRYSLGEETGEQYHYRRSDESVNRPVRPIQVSALKSRYGYIWREARDKYDRHFGVWGGELIVKDLENNDVLAVKKGFFNSAYKICPQDKDVFYTYEFVKKVLRPKQIGILPGKGNE